jgi:hypothetical protein
MDVSSFISPLAKLYYTKSSLHLQPGETITHFKGILWKSNVVKSVKPPAQWLDVIPPFSFSVSFLAATFITTPQPIQLCKASKDSLTD